MELLKKCSKCKIAKHITEFYRQTRSKDGYANECKKCNDARKVLWHRERNKKLGKKPRLSLLDARSLRESGLKRCPRCKKVKLVEEFYTSGSSNKGRASHCIPCQNALQKERYERDKKKHQKRYKRNKRTYKNGKLLRTYGITHDEYDAKLTKQKGGCAICLKTPEENGKMLAVDHNHVTGENRGLLCASCNILIGFIEKNSLRVGWITNYLEAYSFELYAHT